MTEAPPARQILRAYAERRAPSLAVFRALASHDDWLVPALYVVQSLGRESLEGVVLFSERFSHPEGTLLVHTDMAAAVRSQEQGAELGPFVSGIRGVELLSHLQGYQVLAVNTPGPQ